jgi:AhpD family alkylhydroperoxidase
MNKRVNIWHTEPTATNALLAFESYLETTALTHTHKELIRMRASQINGCAYCLNMHSKDALKSGEKAQRLFVLSAWRETDFFTEEEQAVLMLTEEITEISKGGVSDATYEKAAGLFDEVYLSQLIMAVIIINSWNRLAITIHSKTVMDK